MFKIPSNPEHTILHLIRVVSDYAQDGTSPPHVLPSTILRTIKVESAPNIDPLAKYYECVYVYVCVFVCVSASNAAARSDLNRETFGDVVSQDANGHLHREVVVAGGRWLNTYQPMK